MTKRRNVIVHIATSADGFIAGPDGDLEWLTSRPKPKGFYGIGEFTKSIDTKVFGRKTYDAAMRMGGRFDTTGRTYVFSHHARPVDAPAAVEFVNEPIDSFVSRLRDEPGKDIWLMGGGELIASFLDASAIDQIILTVMPLFIGDGIPLIPRQQRHTLLDLRAVERFDDGVVQLHYDIKTNS